MWQKYISLLSSYPRPISKAQAFLSTCVSLEDVFPLPFPLHTFFFLLRNCWLIQIKLAVYHATFSI